jgi:hypothetical protein
MGAEPIGEPLEAVLQDVYLALRAGDLLRLEELCDRTEAALTHLSGPTDARMAERLRDLAHRNAACLEAAARGIRAARRRVAEIRDAQTGTRTYDGNGQYQLIARPSDRLSCRA